MIPIEDYGNKLSIVGMVLGNGNEAEMILLEEANYANISILVPKPDQLAAVFKQLDTLEITNSAKTILRKSQRQIDQKVAWKVFRRDNYSCVYCGDNNTPLTVDHLVLWEEMGDTVPLNLVSACKKCNHTRGNTSVDSFLMSNYYRNLPVNENRMEPYKIIAMWNKAKELPLRKPRSR